MSNVKNLAAITATALLLQGCASVVSGSSQSVSITTNPVSGATCELTNDAGKWFVNATPGSTTIHREASDLTVLCNKGSLHGDARVVSVTKDVAFGNILAGGLIGVAVDRSNGSAFDYPTVINVPMSEKGIHTDILPPPEPDNKPEENSVHKR